MSPTMTEGTIHKWQKKEGEAFSAGDVLLEMETDKAQIDVEAPEDGILAKIVLGDGQKGAVNSLIALLAEEGDDISNVQVPEDQQQEGGNTTTTTPAKEQVENKVTAPPPSPVAPLAHHDLDTSMLKKPLSPAVFSLVMRHHIKDLGAIEASGPGGRILKGDVLAHLGLIAPQPAPKPRHSCAPPRDQIEIAKPASEAKETKAKKEETPVLPNYIERQISMDALINLNGTRANINDLISKAAGRALQEVNDGKIFSSGNSEKGIVSQARFSGFSPSAYKGGVFKVFHLAEPTYDFITDSYVGSKPYTLNVNGMQCMSKTKAKKETMVDIIDYLGGQSSSSSSTAARTVSLNGSRSSRSVSSDGLKQQGYYVNMKLEGGAPGKLMSDQKARLFLDRLEYYVRNPCELVV
ncbi:unnamed protein product [Absidia cylindrospora]